MNRTFWDCDFELLNLSDEGDADLIFDLIPAIKFMVLAVENGERILSCKEIEKEKCFCQEKIPKERTVKTAK